MDKITESIWKASERIHNLYPALPDTKAGYPEILVSGPSLYRVIRRGNGCSRSSGRRRDHASGTPTSPSSLPRANQAGKTHKSKVIKR